MSDDQPEFLRGLFEWDGLGYQVPADALPRLLDPHSLRHGDPWLVLGGVLARARSSDLDSLPLLIECMKKSDQALLRSGCADLLGDAGTSSLLRQLPQAFADELARDDFSFQISVCQAFHQSMLLSTVPLMLAIYLRSTERSETGAIPMFLSHLLEPLAGPLADRSIPDEEYRRLVMTEYEAAREEFGTDRVPLLYGEVFHVPRLAERMLNNLTQKEPPDEVAVSYQRHFFEAATGIDCSGFYRDEDLQPLSAAAIIEEFLDGPDVDNYEEGVRYFFGHRIPEGDAR